jgi:hypothetical protein
MKHIFICKVCGNSFERHVFSSSACTFDFCSPSCRNKSRILIKIPCPICGKKFPPKRNDTGPNGEKIRKRFCSVECGNMSKRNKPSTNPKTHTENEVEFLRDNYPTKGAEWCADQLGYSVSAIFNLVNRNGIVLTKETYKNRVHAAAQKYMTGETNPNWRGGVTCHEWGDNWNKQRHACLARDKKTCQICGCSACSVHHIQPRRLFSGHVEDSNVLSNLVTLCQKHHLLVECGKIKLDVS